jgi:hypothetical protein
MRHNKQRSGRPARDSERVMVPWRPGNAGKGKDAYFWCAKVR